MPAGRYLSDPACKRGRAGDGLAGMDTSRRRSHRTIEEYRSERLADALAVALRDWADAMGFHPCPSCEVDLAIAIRRARELGVEVPPEPPC